jgi:hypothetical protein
MQKKRAFDNRARDRFDQIRFDLPLETQICAGFAIHARNQASARWTRW